jgi:hypothetical protein
MKGRRLAYNDAFNCIRGRQMIRAAEFRHLAKTIRVRAAREESPIFRAEWDNLAESYVRLAEQTDKRDDVLANVPLARTIKRKNK